MCKYVLVPKLAEASDPPKRIWVLGTVLWSFCFVSKEGYRPVGQAGLEFTVYVA